ncbi:hypothetical protein [Natronorubrum sp. DTA28]|uniref:hypothetical protein n=1 Tax=Natronorubrum sp. DTA28 TaxID=3447019 RepID=UPI003F859644
MERVRSHSTFEYLAFLRVNEEFILGPPKRTASSRNSLLVTQGLKDEMAALEDQAENPVTILQASELERDLERILLEIL